MQLKLSLLGILLVMTAPSVHADIEDSYRKSNAVVLYDFNETTGAILDTANPKFGDPLNLEIYYPGSAIRTPGTLEISEPNVIRSLGPADKIQSQCKSKGELSVEVWLENNESVEKRAGQDASKRSQPLRIVSLSTGLMSRNFVLGQFYDMGNFYQVGVATSSNENESTMKGNSLKDPLSSSVASTIVPDPSVNRTASLLQKVVFTLGSSGVGRLYLSDRNGFMYLAQTANQGFGSAAAANYFSSWRSGAYLTLGNENISKDEFATVSSLNKNFQGCSATRNASDQCFTNPNRYWKGKLHKVAVYCQEVPREIVLGAGSQNILKNAALDIDINTQITPLRKKAQSIFSRLTGVKTPITNPVLGEMENLLSTGDALGAAAKATNESAFLNITVRDFASKMSNRDETINVPLNDFTATVVGFVRDDLNAKQMLTENIVYQADPAKAPVPSDLIDDRLRSNNHYEALTTGRYDLKQVLIKSTQKLFNGTVDVDNPSPAGLLTTRQWMAAHAIAGTNRRLVEYTFRQFTCQGIDQVADSTGPDNVIGPDIDRFPGGSHSKFTTSCRACHTIMDGFRPAFSRWTFSNNFAKHAYVVPTLAMNADEDTAVGMKQDPQYVTYKLNKNTTVFPEGRITMDDSWVNNATRGSNKDKFTWAADSGKGIRAFGQLISESKQFPVCMATRVFKQICKRAPASTDQAMIDKVAKEFAAERSYSLKFLFQRIVSTEECLGGTDE